MGADDRRLASTMVEYWTTFAHRGTPNTGGSAHATWNRYDADRDNVMLLDTTGGTEIDSFGERHHCDFWDEVTLGASINPE